MCILADGTEEMHYVVDKHELARQVRRETAIYWKKIREIWRPDIKCLKSAFFEEQKTIRAHDAEFQMKDREMGMGELKAEEVPAESDDDEFMPLPDLKPLEIDSDEDGDVKMEKSADVENVEDGVGEKEENDDLPDLPHTNCHKGGPDLYYARRGKFHCQGLLEYTGIELT